MSLNKCEGVKFICETHLSSIQCVYFWFIHNPIVELQSKNYLGITVRDRRKKIGDHFGVGIISGSGSFHGRGSFQGQFGDRFGVGIISGSIWGSFRGRDHFRVNLGIVSGSGSFQGRDHFTVGDHFRVNLGIVSGSGSFQGRDHFGGCTGRFSLLLNGLLKSKIIIFTSPN